MNNTIPPWERDPKDVLLSAIHVAQNSPETSEIELAQLWGSLSGSPQLQELFITETGPLRTSISFHLDGEVVSGHSIETDLFVDLVQGVSTATMSTAQSEAEKLKRLKTDKRKISLSSFARPLVLTAISQGSVRFALEVSERPEPKDEEGLPGISPIDLDDQALRTVIEVLFSDGDSQLLKMIPPKARRELSPAAKAISTYGLDVSVEIKQRHQTTLRKKVDHIAAKKLYDVLQEPIKDFDSIDGVFKLDGYKKSEGALYLVIDGESRKLSVEPSLLSRIRALDTDETEDVWLFCEIELVMEDAPGKRRKTERILTWAEKADPSIHHQEHLRLVEDIDDLSD